MKTIHIKTVSRKKDLPFTVTEENLFMGKQTMHLPDIPHYKSSEAKETAPRAVREVKKVVQNYPRVVREIRRIQPREILYSTCVQPESEIRASTGSGYIGIRRGPFPTKKWIPLFARTLAHELKHVEQERRHQIPEGIEFEEDYWTYRNLPWEKEANKFAKRIVPYHRGWSF